MDETSTCQLVPSIRGTSGSATVDAMVDTTPEDTRVLALPNVLRGPIAAAADEAEELAPEFFAGSGRVRLGLEPGLPLF